MTRSNSVRKKKKPARCPRRSHSFTVAQIGKSPFGAKIGLTEDQAQSFLDADPGDTITFYHVCARTPEEARIAHAAKESVYTRKRKVR